MKSSGEHAIVSCGYFDCSKQRQLKFFYMESRLQPCFVSMLRNTRRRMMDDVGIASLSKWYGNYQNTICWFKGTSFQTKIEFSWWLDIKYDPRGWFNNGQIFFCFESYYRSLSVVVTRSPARRVIVCDVQRHVKHDTQQITSQQFPDRWNISTTALLWVPATQEVVLLMQLSSQVAREVRMFSIFEMHPSNILKSL